MHSQGCDCTIRGITHDLCFVYKTSREQYADNNVAVHDVTLASKHRHGGERTPPFLAAPPLVCLAYQPRHEDVDLDRALNRVTS